MPYPEFPTSPASNERYTYNDITWKWNSTTKSWEKILVNVKLLNGLSGGITLAAGSGVSLGVNQNQITITNTGVLSNIAGSGINVSGSTGNVTITNIGVTGFNGLTGNVFGVTGINAGTGVSVSGSTNLTVTNTGVISFNGLTGAVTGVTSTAANTWYAAQTFTVAPIINVGSPVADEILYSADTSGTLVWQYPPQYVITSTSGTRFMNPFTTTTINATATSASNTTVYYFPFVITSTCQVKASVFSGPVAPTTTGNYYAKVYNASRTTGKPSGSSVGDFGTIAITGSATTAFTSSTGITLSPGFYWVGYSFSAAVNNLKRWTADTTSSSRYGGLITPAAATQTYVIGYTETVAADTAPPATVGSLTEILNSTTTTPALALLVV